MPVVPGSPPNGPRPAGPVPVPAGTPGPLPPTGPPALGMRAGSAAPVPVPAGTVIPRIRGAEEEEADELLTEIAAKNAPSWLISTLIHIVLILVFGLLVIRRGDDGVITILSEPPTFAEELGEQIEEHVLTSDPESVEPEEVRVESVLPEVDDPFAAPPDLPPLPDGLNPISDIQAPAIGLALKGRSEGRKQALLRAYGGNRQTEQAVMDALRWLSRQQQKDGSWSLKGPYDDGGMAENTAAATAMALLAYQGAGYTHTRKTEFQSNVGGGIKYLLSLQNGQGLFSAEGGSNQLFYTQAQCTIAVCELYAMSSDTSLRDPAQRAVQYLVQTQYPDGGWRYGGTADGGDMSVTGWVVMALQSARMGGLEVPQETLDRIGKFLDSVSGDGGITYSYQPGMDPTETMTAEGLLCRQYLGWPQDEPRLVEGCKLLLSRLPVMAQRDVYYWYYATQTLHHMEGDYWTRWNDAQRDMLVKAQQQTGAERGSWHPRRPTQDRWANYGGRLYVTCLSTYILEVYYRHLPIYSTKKIFAETSLP